MAKKLLSKIATSESNMPFENQGIALEKQLWCPCQRWQLQVDKFIRSTVWVGIDKFIRSTSSRHWKVHTQEAELWAALPLTIALLLITSTQNCLFAICTLQHLNSEATLIGIPHWHLNPDRDKRFQESDWTYLWTSRLALFCRFFSKFLLCKILTASFQHMLYWVESLD